MFLLLTALASVLTIGLTQLSTNSSGISIYLTPELTVWPSASTMNTVNAFRDVEMTKLLLITLTSENIVQILSRANPNIVIQTYEKYVSSNSQA